MATDTTIQVGEERDWRRKPQVLVLGESPSGYGWQGQVPVNEMLTGPYAEYDLQRVLDATVCINCWTTFPDRPGPTTYRHIANELRAFVLPRPIAEVRRLLKEGKCPVCAWEVSPEMARLHFVGEAEPVERRLAPGEEPTG